MNGLTPKMSGNAFPGPVRGLFLLLELSKFHLSIYITLSAMFGQVLAGGRFGLATLGLGLGVWILVSGAALVNNVQDRIFDSHGGRTRTRALVQKRIAVPPVLVGGWVFILGGLVYLAIGFEGQGTWLLGGLGIFFYNGLYTPLKKRTVGAVFPGVVCGMLPPAMGWMAVPLQYRLQDTWPLVLTMLAWGLWQIPHFMVIHGRYPLPPGPYPCLSHCFSPVAFRGQVIIWTSLYSLSLFLFILHQGVFSLVCASLLAVNALVLPPLMAAFLLDPSRIPKGCQRAIHLSILVFMVMGMVDVWI